MPASQGKYPAIARTPGAGTFCGRGQGGTGTTSDSFEYRGRPYTLANKIDQMAFDWNREQVKISVQKGMRILGLYLTTSQNP